MTIAEAVAEFSLRHPDAPATLLPAGEGIVLGLSGALDMKISHDVDSLLSEVIDLAEVGQLFTVDLAKVDYISSTGVGSLVMALTRARKRNITLKLRDITDKVRSVFDLLGFLQFFGESRTHE
ncbi:MAG: STAS domain-containing protein [Rectinemataceae bacterium]